ncbi:DUF4097 family beta strand repeat-containing protein [Crossiella sp. CA198]|uniref:DUF4097 family beta strand repeat-containing protein n=1 Tax=Crossiella sp. CA198 TaxID=3455607 RepID=UPI003F8D0542
MRMLKVGAALVTGAVLLSGCSLIARNRETQQQDFEQKIAKLEVTLDSGDVEVRAGGDGKVSVTRKLEWANNKPVAHEEWSGETLRITPPTCSNNCGINYVITVPAAIAVQLRTDSGAVSVYDVKGDLRLETDSGDVRADNPVAALWARTGSGTVTTSGARSPKAELHTDSGDITAGFAAAPGSVVAEAGSGAVTVTVPKEPAGYQVTAKTDSGKKDIAVTQEASSPRTISATADSGDVTVKYG